MIFVNTFIISNNTYNFIDRKKLKNVGKIIKNTKKQVKNAGEKNKKIRNK